ncbi:MAG: hypothetical protein ACXVB9_03115 [Bdellovibrionota bacterium]
MKKVALAALTGLFAVTAFAAAPPRLDDSIADLNTAVIDLLHPYNTEASHVMLAFQTLTTDDTNVLSTSLIGDYQRIGKVQTMNVHLNGLRFDFVNGNPIVNLAAGAGFDITQVFAQEQLNGLVDGAEGMVEDLASNYTKPYGTAASVKATMIEKLKNAKGDYTGFKATVAVKLDMGKLPAGKKSEDVPLQSAVVYFDVNFATGIVMNGTVMMNPEYRGFHGQGTTLKMAIQKLLDRDGDAGKRITTYLDKLDKMAGNLVDARIKE